MLRQIFFNSLPVRHQAGIESRRGLLCAKNVEVYGGVDFF